MIKLCKTYISNILLERRDKLVEEVKKMIRDKHSTLSSIKSRESEIELISDQLKIMENIKNKIIRLKISSIHVVEENTNENIYSYEKIKRSMTGRK